MNKISVEEGLVKHARFMFFKAYRLANRNHHDAQDLVNEAVCLAMEAKDTWESFNLTFQTWIKYHLLTARRRYKLGSWTIRDASLSENVPIDSEGLVLFDLDDCDIDLKDMIAKMPFPEIAMYAYSGYKQTDICELTGLSLATIKRRSKKNTEFYKEQMNENHNQ